MDPIQWSSLEVAAVRKMIEATLVSLDGVMGNPEVWAQGYFGEEATQLAIDRLRGCDALLMGRSTYQLLSGGRSNLLTEYANRLNEIRKYVFSSTLETVDWNNSVLVRGDFATEVARLKQEDGGDIVVYGHGRLGEALLKHNLLDELHFWIHPVFVGGNAVLFRKPNESKLRLVATKTLTNGVVILSYQPA